MGEPIRWRWLRSGPGGAAWNMALDEALLRTASPRPTLRTYGWDPATLSLGYFQEVDRVRVTALVAEGYGLVRRTTGGRAIFHGDELTYSVVWPRETPGGPADAVGAYDLFHGVLIRALARVGVTAGMRGDRELVSDRTDDDFWCFYRSTSFDLVAGDRKLVGSAQRRTARGMLMHGSIPLTQNPLTPETAWVGVEAARLEEALAAEFERTAGSALEIGEPTADEIEIAERLSAGRYAEDRWTFQRTASPRPRAGW